MYNKLTPTKFSHIKNNRYRQYYHITTPGGWLNDPNGLCFFKGYYHVFYQYHPYSAEWGPMHWGHVRSKDLIHWEQLPIALTPNDKEDSGGCFSGSAIIKDGRLYLFYTGHNYYQDDDLDHFYENQNVAYSDDGINFHKYDDNPIITTPNDNTQHFRDPKVWQYDDNYYMVIGSQDKNDNLGRVLLYQSADLLNWKSCGAIAHSTSKDQEGWMWECPDLFELNGRDLLICSPMGIRAEKNSFLNLSQTCYSIGELDYQKNKFLGTIFQEVDHGHNFYATQTLLTPDGRRILIGWMSPFEEKMEEQADGWAGSLTLPRELILEGNCLKNRPIKELKQLRTSTVLDEYLTLTGRKSLPAEDVQHSEYFFRIKEQAIADFSWQIDDSTGTILKLKQKGNKLILFRRGEKDQYRYATLNSPLSDIHIFVDTSSVECFINDGAISFTERYYTTKQLNAVINSTDCQLHGEIYTLKEDD
ncbi:glycoside hydrolase family 32 protein [Limosilactobacillus sp. RRLNB_1_1]|uniref:Sucrose-6-phosphate hydrolase n=1 Tax=Limosilactobacillus albertensis TaxID=2759752 RepID=A0A7W3TTI5_9LACO|nr:glycoside hydrolase family 32 protein [Limosilactobacillus albertensis]MBB1070351.1 glycoside hydrolase family 32 protein [Limosilactobacillus albertensis]MCD7117890.1 glycoside hydrolase family 32 protein [Limosilactobacillus albertensis]MCD7128438.1 glycoside hydrolase family 32 protein [Limosilactobacillus albertensis]